MPISRKTIEEMIAKYDAESGKLRAAIAKIDSEAGVLRKLLAADSDAPKSPKGPPRPRVPGETGEMIEQRCIAAIQSAGKVMHVTEIAKAIGRGDGVQESASMYTFLYRRAKDGPTFVACGGRTFGLKVLGHKPPETTPRVMKLLEGRQALD